MELGPVHHVSINVDDVESTAPFYTDVLGMTVLPRPDFAFNGRWLQTPGRRRGAPDRSRGLGATPRASTGPSRWTTSTPRVTELRDRGVEVDDPRPLPGTPARQTFFFDPAGNMIELNQPA